jgi:predicted RNA binding protein YcfA (HicA-like mRNA interferase family)
VSKWRSSKAKQVLAALLRIGWKFKRQVGSHQLLERAGWSDYVFAFHDRDEIGPRMLAKIAKKTGLRPEDF